MNISRANSASNILKSDDSPNSDEPVWRRRNGTDDLAARVASEVPPLPPNLLHQNGGNTNFRNHFPTKKAPSNTKSDRNLPYHPADANYLLWITPVAASLSVAIIVAAIAGPQWLFTEERLSKQYLNVTVYYKPRGDDTDYITKFTKSSLWILCTEIGDEFPLEYHCKAIDYFPNETYSPDPIDSTAAIQYAITTSTPSLLVANFIHVVSYILLMLAMFSNKHTIYYFVSGVSFIFSGLLMLIGIILYISIFKAEVGSKLKPKSSLQEEALFSYRYGYSFVLYVVGILLVFVSGLLNVFLYTSFHNEPTLKPLPRDSPCFAYRKFHKVVDSRKPSISSPAHRYVLRKDPNCNIHASRVAKSLNQLYTEPAPDVAPFDFPCTILTRSVSTLTDDLSPLRQKRKEGNLINNMCGIGKSFLTHEKTDNDKSPRMQSRPKDIYFIEHDGDDDLSNVFVIEPIESFQRRRRNSMYGEVPNNSKSISNNSLGDLDKIISTDYANFGPAMPLYEKYGTKAFSSRTLPRNFAQKNFARYAEDGPRVSASGIFISNETFPYSLSSSASNILDPPHDYRLSSPTSTPMWPKIIINSPSHPPPSSLPPTIGCATKYQRIRNNLNLKKLSNSLDNILMEDDEAGSPTFDLDRIERERRRSHASLFDTLSVYRGSSGKVESDGTPV